MKKISVLLLLTFASTLTFWGQKAQRYENPKTKAVHLCGPFDLTELTRDTTYNQWFEKYYALLKLQEGTKGSEWIKHLEDVHVEVYMGTWCGDTKYWVPQFVKIWDELGLDRKQLSFIALYDGSTGSNYKQGPHHEEVGKNIHRVPTFIFKRKDKELARIVERPVNSLETDLAQIAYGYPSVPNYKVANLFMSWFDTLGVDSVYTFYDEYISYYRRNLSSSSELNTLAGVLEDAQKIKEALLVYKVNTMIFKHEPRVYLNYAKLLDENGAKETAAINYEKVLLLDRGNEAARKALKSIKELEKSTNQ